MIDELKACMDNCNEQLQSEDVGVLDLHSSSPTELLRCKKTKILCRFDKEKNQMKAELEDLHSQMEHTSKTKVGQHLVHVLYMFPWRFVWMECHCWTPDDITIDNFLMFDCRLAEGHIMVRLMSNRWHYISFWDSLNINKLI